MKKHILVLLCVAWSGLLLAAPPEQTSADPQPEKNLGEAKVEKPIKLEKTVSREDQWTQAKHGVVGQFVQAPHVLDPINPAAKTQAGWGDGNLSKDTITGRIMGLRLLKFEF